MSTNWDYLFANSPKHIKNLLYKIPKSDINEMSRNDAIDYIKSLMRREEIVPKPNPLKITPAENMLKFDMHPGVSDTEPVLAYKNNERIYNNALASGDKQCLENLLVRSSVDMLRTLEHLPQYLQPTVSFESVKLPRRSLLLDSRNRESANDNYSWYLTTNTGQINRGQINARQLISQIVEISCAPFRIPILTRQNMVFYKRVRMGIVEFANEGTEITLNSQYTKRSFYHFEFACQADGDYLELTPIAPWRPGRPIAQCDQLTINFFGNTEMLTLQPDQMICSYIAGVTTIFTSPTNHNLTTGDVIYVESGELYNDQGYIIWVISLTQFGILQPNTLGGSANVYFASKRIQVQLNFTCLEN